VKTYTGENTGIQQQQKLLNLLSVYVFFTFITIEYYTLNI